MKKIYTHRELYNFKYSILTLKKEVSINIKELREKAIKRYENGESPKEIYQSFGKGKSWFFKWLKRYKY
jgi:transposase